MVRSLVSRSLVLLWCSAVLGCASVLNAPVKPKAVASAGDDASVRRISVTTSQGIYSVWTQKRGDNPAIKVLLLHGGPGGTHEYFEGLEPALLKAGVEFYYFDQLGSGQSAQPDDVTMEKLLSIDRSVEEVEQVRRGLGLDEQNFFLLGHSWGGIVAMEYALKYPKVLKGLIISNMMASAPAYNRYAKEVLMPAMDQSVLKQILALEAKKDFDNPAYEKLLEGFYGEHVLRMPRAQWPEPVSRAFSHFNLFIYRTMQGPSEMGLSGKLEHWDVTGRLKDIVTPTLVIGATHDTMDPKHMAWVAKTVQRGTFLLCPHGSHMAFYDDAKVYAEGLVGFLKSVE